METREITGICEHCGQELKKASDERQEIKAIQAQNISDVSTALIEEQNKVADTLSIRQDKLDLASQEMLDIVQRIEKKVGADAQALEDVKALEVKIRAKIAAQAKAQDEEKESA